ncbi:MAG: class I SAM-dependent methyltransferase [Bacteroidia bacterium]|nr:class I SAM-dependent methyltransferase [Bacteroidia bacterium]
MKPPLKQGSKDDFQTPPSALEPLYKFLKPSWTIWECAAGKGNLSRALRRKGYKVISTDILSGHDFLEYEPKEYDCTITNPPFSLKQEFLQRAYCLGKPFAFLLPLTTLESAKRQFLFRCRGLELILFDHRINFETPDCEGEGSWFATAWFTNGLKIGKELTFVAKNESKRKSCRLSCEKQ